MLFCLQPETSQEPRQEFDICQFKVKLSTSRSHVLQIGRLHAVAILILLCVQPSSLSSSVSFSWYLSLNTYSISFQDRSNRTVTTLIYRQFYLVQPISSIFWNVAEKTQDLSHCIDDSIIQYLGNERWCQNYDKIKHKPKIIWSQNPRLFKKSFQIFVNSLL